MLSKERSSLSKAIYCIYKLNYLFLNLHNPRAITSLPLVLKTSGMLIAHPCLHNIDNLEINGGTLNLELTLAQWVSLPKLHMIILIVDGKLMYGSYALLNRNKLSIFHQCALFSSIAMPYCCLYTSRSCYSIEHLLDDISSTCELQ